MKEFLDPALFDQPAVRGRITGDGYQVTDPSGTEWTVLLCSDGWEAYPFTPYRREDVDRLRVRGEPDVDDLVTRIVHGRMDAR